MAKKKEIHKAIPIEEESNEILKITYSEPIFNEQTNLFEIKKIDSNGNELDIFSDPNKETLLTKREEMVREYILSLVNKKEKKDPEKRKLQFNQTRAQIIEDIIRLKLEGVTVDNIYKVIRERKDTCYLDCGFLLVEAMGRIKERSIEVMDKVLDLHLERYEELYKWFRENGYVKYANKVLKARENLMGVGGQEVVGVRIDNIIGNNILNKEVLFQSSKLSNKELEKISDFFLRMELKENKE